ncbi:hypothetical protein BOTBODRAFT_170531 [Botryobasidium botryosum FD-172 SS1]|uniref:HTH APSES-type domain-containing protein n=1 Tax=Botryobasidium botryosum (strain FD-172 SS1) TaxID=930990 RepID=A0A067MXL0_BOTB1|nr:hypothetical protein BOTBODRAFT_170531 [Botryobasidium botryosum FD-172 SS1]
MAAPPPAQAPRVYNAIYSSVQVYECMVRGIAVMRRRADSYVNATQILKVAGVDKGRRTKILEKEILPGTHEIVQGGYGKYQGTWIPLEKGREVATQFGVAPLLAPLFDYSPMPASVGTMPPMLPQQSHQQYRGAGPSGMSQRTAQNPSQHGPYTHSHTYASSHSQPQHHYPPPQNTYASPYTQSAQSYGQPLQQSSSQQSYGSSASHSPAPGTPASFKPHQPNRSQGSYTPPVGSQGSKHPSSQQSQQSHHQNTASGQASTPPPSSYPGLQSSQQSHREATPSHATSSLKRPRVEDGAEAHSQRGSMDFSMTAEGPGRGSNATPGPSNGSMPSPAKRPRTGSTSNGSRAAHLDQYRPPPSPTPSMMNGLASASGPSTKSGPDLQPRFFTKPSRIHLQGTSSNTEDRLAPLKSSKHSTVLVSMIHDADPGSVIEMLTNADPAGSNGSSPSPSSIDVVLDDQGHTALHWASALSRVNLVSVLIQHGADVHRGNFAGETPLMRTVLSTHASDAQSFPALLALLQASLRTVDSSSRSVLHHIAHVAGVRGRAASARYYMESVLEYIARHQGAEFRGLIDLQDVNGDTTLNVAARIGNRSLVRMLIDVGANKTLGNKLGLKPGDFGVEGEGPSADDILSALRTGPSIPVQKSKDVISDMTAMIQDLSADFAAEVKIKQDALDATQTQLRAATRELAEQRRQIQTWQAACGELDQVHQRIRNIDRALKEEDEFDWTGRTELDDEPATAASAGAAFQHRGPQSTLAALGSTFELSFNLDVDPAIPTTDSLATLIRLRRLKAWHARIEMLMDGRLEKLRGASAEKEVQCKKIVSLCTGVPMDKVEQMLEHLVIAMESDGPVPELGRVAGFMQKVRDGVI